MTRIAGSRRASEVVNIDYADVMRQAVVNERLRVLREIRDGMEAVRFFESDYEWEANPRKDAKGLRRDVLAVVDRVARMHEEGL